MPRQRWFYHAAPPARKAPLQQRRGAFRIPSSTKQMIQPGPTDEELFARYATAGDAAAFTTLYERYYPRILGFLDRRLQHEADAEELAAETFLRVVRSRNRFDPSWTFSTWVFTIANRLALNLFRSRSRRREVAFSDLRPDRSPSGGTSRPLDLALSRADPEHDAYTGELRAGIELAIEQLEPHHRVAFVMRELEDHTYGEIAEAAGIPVGTVKSRIARARSNFAASFRPVAAAPRPRRGTPARHARRRG